MIATVSDPQGGPDPHRRPKDRRPERRLHDRADHRPLHPGEGGGASTRIHRAVRCRKRASDCDGSVHGPHPCDGHCPLFDGNNYGDVYEREPMILDEGKRKQIIVELYHLKSAASLYVRTSTISSRPTAAMLWAKKQKSRSTSSRRSTISKTLSATTCLSASTTAARFFPRSARMSGSSTGNNVGVGRT